MNTQQRKETSQTRKGNKMKNTITKKSAVETALTFVPETETEVREVLTKMVAQLSKPRTPASDEAKAKRAAVQKEKTAKARAELVAVVAPVLRKHLTTDVTAKELFEAAKDELPADFSPAKVQNVLLREMKDELVKTETKGKANTYRLS